MNSLLLVALGLTALATLTVATRAVLNMRKRVNMANAANQPNAGRNLTGIKTMLADAAITRYYLVKSGSDAAHVAVSAADTDVIWGIAQDSADAAEDPIAVAILGACTGTQFVIATGVIAVNTFVCSNGDGTVKAIASAKYAIGKTLQASGATGDQIEIAPMLQSLTGSAGTL